MKKLIAMVVLSAATCAAFAEEESFWSRLFSSETETASETAAAQDSQIAKLNKKLEELTAQLDKAKTSSKDEFAALKKKYEEVKAQLKAKLEEYKGKAKSGKDSASAAYADEYQRTKTNAVNFVNGLKNLFK